MQSRKISRVLISVFNKDGLAPVLDALSGAGAGFISTGGTKAFIEQMKYPVSSIEEITGYPSILDGRVKTLHPSIFGGILFRRNKDEDQIQTYAILPIDMVIVDLYPFEKTVAEKEPHDEIIEKIDIGGVSLIRAAAKNYQDVLTVSSRDQYAEIVKLIQQKQGNSDRKDREHFATLAFAVTAHYDQRIFDYFNREKNMLSFKANMSGGQILRYGENPHQKATYYGSLDTLFHQLHGPKLSYNNLVDSESALHLMNEFKEETVFIIIKHTNACGVATGKSVKEAYLKAFETDTLSAFGGVLASNRTLDLEAAQEINKLFFEILIAPDYDEAALELLQSKKNRKIIKQKIELKPDIQFKTILNGIIEQEFDNVSNNKSEVKTVTKRIPSEKEIKALFFANKIAKHTKSNAIVLAVEGRMLASGVGQTSRIDALHQAIAKAKHFNSNTKGAVMASDAFFPFPDCVEIAHRAGIKAVIQPGGSIKDQESIDFCDSHNMAMICTGLRHFKH